MPEDATSQHPEAELPIPIDLEPTILKLYDDGFSAREIRNWLVTERRVEVAEGQVSRLIRERRADEVVRRAGRIGRTAEGTDPELSLIAGDVELHALEIRDGWSAT